jgi:cardiolipin synthase A/B
MDLESIELRGLLVGLWLVYFVVIAIWIVLQKRDPAATLSWIFSLALLPYLGFVIFYVFGPRRIRRSRSRRQASYTAISETFAASVSLQAADSPRDLSVQLTEMVRRATGIPLSTCRAIRLLVDGGEKYDAVCDAIAAAKHHVHLEYYTYAGDESGTRIRDALIAARRRGDQVRMLMDGAGSWKTGKAFLAPLRDAGADVGIFHSMLGLPRLRPLLNFRSHRKIVVVDGVVGFTGGINVTDDENERVKPDTYYRDLHARLEGDVVAWMQRVFLEDWHYVTGKAPRGDGYFVAPNPGPCAVQIMPSGPDNAWEPIHRAHLIGIHSANARVWLMTPYFVPTEASLYAVTSAALRGLDVRVMVPKRSDSRLVDMAARSYFDHLVEAGVRVFVYQPRMLHSKALLIDDSFAILGSSNFDARSFRTNFELSIAVHEIEIARAIEAVWATDLGDCIEIKPSRPRAAFPSRLGEATARLCSPLL